MYTRRNRQRPPLITLILIAAVAGIIFVILDNRPDPGASTPTPPPTNTAPIVAAAPTTTPQPPAATPTLPSVPTVESSSNIPGLPNIPDDAILFIASAAIYTNIVEAFLDGTSWDVSRLGNNVGHLQGTSWIANGGNTVLSGHVELADGRRGVFANLYDVSVGDIIEIITGGENWRYIVTDIETTTPTDLTPVLPTQEDRLTLITCGSYNFLSNVYQERLIVVAQRI